MSGVLQIALYIDLYFASFMPGAAAGLGYANLLAMAPIGIVSSSLLVRDTLSNLSLKKEKDCSIAADMVSTQLDARQVPILPRFAQLSQPHTASRLCIEIRKVRAPRICSTLHSFFVDRRCAVRSSDEGRDFVAVDHPCIWSGNCTCCFTRTALRPHCAISIPTAVV